MPTKERNLLENDASVPSSQPRLLPPEWPSYTRPRSTPESGSASYTPPRPTPETGSATYTHPRPTPETGSATYTHPRPTPESGSASQASAIYVDDTVTFRLVDDKAATPDSADNSASGSSGQNLSPDDSALGPSRRNLPLTPWAGPVILLTAVGALGQAWIGYQGRTTEMTSSVLFYLTLCMIYTPSAALILSRKLTDNAKVWFTGYMSLTLYATRILQYPTAFAGHDELVHYAIATSIDKTSHLYHPNSILPEASYYPGLEIVTNALQHATGLSLHSAACIVIALATIIATLSLVLLMRRITGSMTAACLVALVYTCNQENLYFNTDYSYASMALPLAFFCIYVFTLRSKSAKIYGLIPVLAVFVALAATHHLTSLAVVVLLWGWNRVTQLTGRRVPQLFTFLALSTLVLVLWTFFARKYVITYIRQSLTSSVVSIEKLINGQSTHKLFSTPAGYQTPRWEIFVSFGSVVLIMLALIPAAWYVVWRWRLAAASGIVLTAMALIYPIVPLGHLTADSSEVSDRLSPFIFCGIAYVVAVSWFCLLGTQRTGLRAYFNGSPPWRALARARGQWPALAWLSRWRSALARVSRWRPTTGLVLGLTLCLVGGGIIGASDWSYVPGKYLVSADNRSLDQLALAAGSWEAANIKPNSRAVSDRDNGLIAQSFGGLHLVTPAADGVDEGALSNLLLRYPASSDVATVCADHVQYLIADARLATALPEVGVYVDQGEYLYGIRTVPPPVADLTKFDQVQGAERIYDNGAVRIFDLEGLSCPS